MDAVPNRKSRADDMDPLTITSRARPHRPPAPTSIGPVPLASLSGPQRRLVTALLDAARAAEEKKGGQGGAS